MKTQAALGAPSPSEAQWVEGELVRNLMQTQRDIQWVSLLLIPLLVGVLWGDTERPLLLGWAAFALAVAAARSWMLRSYDQGARGSGNAEHLAFFRRHQLIWPLSAVVWGLTPALQFDHAPMADQFVCWLLLAGIAMFSINTLSPRVATMHVYLNTLGCTAVAVMVWHIAIDLRFQAREYHWWLLTMLLMFWQVLRYAGERLHETHRSNFSLQYRNNQLIESLTRQTQAALDAVEIKNRFLASAAHDIRQPVHALGLYADWLGSEPELVHELAPKIVESTKAVNQLFDSLFDVARLDSGKIHLNVETVDVAKLLRDLELQYRPVCEAKGLEFRLRLAQGTVVSDPILLQRVVGNLLSNAIKYTRTGGVLLAARAGRQGLRIEVWDTGVGIPLEYQREIFREFYKAPSHSGTQDGFGLGLYIVGRLTHILGHPLAMRSRPGRGSVFRLLLEATDERAAAQRAVNSVARLARRA